MLEFHSTIPSEEISQPVDFRAAPNFGEQQGHKTIQMTVRYAHLAPERQMAAVERLCRDEGAPSESTDTKTSTDSFAAGTNAAAVVQ
jgi:hypothetical protein